MRNLIEYPVTHDEIIQCLEERKRVVMASNCLGDMRPLLLEAAIDIVKANKNIALRFDGKIATVADQ